LEDCPVRVAILGAGAIAYGNAAFLCRDGHDVILWSPSGRRTATLAAGAPLVASGYVTEDVPFGLVPTIRLAGLAGVLVPLHESGVQLMSALYGRDFAAENDILPRLGPLSREMLIPTGAERSEA
jgi:hypothetical protein